MANNAQPSFLSSVKQAAWGYIKGAVKGGVVGIGVGLVGGAIVGVFTGGIGLAALAGASFVGSALSQVGGFAGGISEVIKGRETANRINPQDVVNLANMAFAQGVSSGHQMTQNNPQQAVETSSKFQDMLKQRAAQQQAARTR